MTGIRTMHDIRSARSIASRAIPSSEGAVFLQLHRLANEKRRLENEAELWLRKKERIERRLGEIEQQMESIRLPRAGIAGIVLDPRFNKQEKSWSHLIVEY